MSHAEQPEHDLGEAASHGVRWSAISRPTVEVLQLGSMVVLARLINPAEFGRFAVAAITMELTALTITGGISSALVQRRNADRIHLQTGVTLALVGGVLLTLITLAAGELLVRPIFGARTADFMLMLAPLSLIYAFGAVPQATLSRGMRFRRLAEIEMAGVFIRVALTVTLAVAGLGGESLVIGVLAGAVVATTLAVLSARPPLPHFHRRAARDLVGYALPVSLATLTWVGFSNVDYAVIGARLGAYQAGLYYRSYTLAVEYQSKLGVVMSQIGFPVLARTKDAEQMTRMHRQMVRLLTLALFPALVVLAVAAPVLVPFVFGPQWTGAIVPVQILALGGAATVLMDAAGTILMAAGRGVALLSFGGAHFVVYGIAVFAVAPMGIAAVAIAAAVVHGAFLVVAYVLICQGREEAPLRRLWGDVSPALLSSFGLAIVAVPTSKALTAVGAPSAVWLAALGAVSAAAYLLTLRLCFPDIWTAQRAIIARIFPRRRRPVVEPSLQGA